MKLVEAFSLVQDITRLVHREDASAKRVGRMEEGETERDDRKWVEGISLERSVLDGDRDSDEILSHPFRNSCRTSCPSALCPTASSRAESEMRHQLCIIDDGMAQLKTYSPDGNLLNIKLHARSFPKLAKESPPRDLKECLIMVSGVDGLRVA